MPTIALYITMFSVFIGYNIFILIKYGFLSSISVSYYSLPKKWNWLFLAFCWGYSIPALMLATDGFMFFSGGLICFVGIASAFRDDSFTADMHQWSAAVAITLSQLSIILCYHFYWVSIGMLVSALILYLLRNIFTQWMYVLEIIAFVCIGYVLFLNL
jgi:hypothetical protein